MSTLFPALAPVQSTESSALQNALAAVPRDPASLFILALVVAVIVFIVVVGRRPGGGDKENPGNAP